MFLLNEMRDWVWSWPLLVLLLGTGIFYSLLLKGMQFRYLGYAFRQVVAERKRGAKGDISHFESLMTTLAGAMGTGSIVGVATAVCVGGLGALFWMWVTALFGMATKYAESLLAVKYRVVDERGEMIGGPMEYIERGLGWRKLALAFAFFAAVAALSTGNLVQVNAIVESVGDVAAIDPLVTGILVAVTTAVVILGGVKSIGRVASVLVPFMAVLYLAGGGIILLLHYREIPAAFHTIFQQAFGIAPVLGGLAGTIQMGVARSIFSNEAGMGISSIAAAAAKTDAPGRQAMITMTGALVSTVVVCTMTGLVLAVSGVMGGEGFSSACLPTKAFQALLPGGGLLVTISLTLFAFSTILAWGYYGEKCFEYLLGENWVIPYRVLFVFLIIPGSVLQVDTVWAIADISNAFMVLPNLIALLALYPAVREETDHFLKTVHKEIDAC